MRTAMQELIDWLNKYEGNMISADQVILKSHKLLKKEKKQILNAWFDSDMIITGDEGISYYHHTYNQNK